MRKVVLISNKVNALDLSLIGADIDSFEVGNYYPLIHEILNINSIVRIVEKTISIDNPQNSNITFRKSNSNVLRRGLAISILESFLRPPY